MPKSSSAPHPDAADVISSEIASTRHDPPNASPPWSPVYPRDKSAAPECRRAVPLFPAGRGVVTQNDRYNHVPGGVHGPTDKPWAPLERLCGERATGLQGGGITGIWKVEPTLVDLNEKVGVESWMTLPWARPQAVAVGGVEMVLKLLKAASAGLLRNDRGPKPAPAAFKSFSAVSTPPSASITSGPAQGSVIHDSTPTFSFKSSRVGSTFQCRVDSAPLEGPVLPVYDTTSPTAPTLLGQGGGRRRERERDRVAIVYGRPLTTLARRGDSTSGAPATAGE